MNFLVRLFCYVMCAISPEMFRLAIWETLVKDSEKNPLGALGAALAIYFDDWFPAPEAKLLRAVKCSSTADDIGADLFSLLLIITIMILLKTCCCSFRQNNHSRSTPLPEEQKNRAISNDNNEVLKKNNEMDPNNNNNPQTTGATRDVESSLSTTNLNTQVTLPTLFGSKQRASSKNTTNDSIPNVSTGSRSSTLHRKSNFSKGKEETVEGRSRRNTC